jgi:hypothetical protein
VSAGKDDRSGVYQLVFFDFVQKAFARIAQLVERSFCKAEVRSSTLRVGRRLFFLFFETSNFAEVVREVLDRCCVDRGRER